MCTQYERRTWTCLEDDDYVYVQRNEFNTCYLVPDEADSTTPGSSGPCGNNAPQFAVSDCETYVGKDYVKSPSSPHVDQCEDYDTGSIVTVSTVGLTTTPTPIGASTRVTG